MYIGPLFHQSSPPINEGGPHHQCPLPLPSPLRIPPPTPPSPSPSQDTVTNAARELGLLGLDDEHEEEDGRRRLFLVQLPAVLPISAAAARAGAEEAAAAVAGPSGSRPPASAPPTSACPPSSSSASASAPPVRGCALKELPSGCIGRLLVFRSGKVKLQMGDVLMDVSPGLPCQHRIDVGQVCVGVDLILWKSHTAYLGSVWITSCCRSSSGP